MDDNKARPWERDPSFAVKLEYARLIGIIAMQWSHAEVFFQALVQTFIGLPALSAKAQAATLHIGDQTLAHMLLSITRIEDNAEAYANAEHTTKLHDANRLNRNFYVHGLYFPVGLLNGKSILVSTRTTARGKMTSTQHLATHQEMKDVVQEIEDYRDYLSTLIPALERNLRGKPAPWPQKPPVPKVRTNNPQWRPTSEPPRQSEA